MSERSVGVALDGSTLTVVWRTARVSGTWRTASAPCDATPAGIARAMLELTGDAAQWNGASIAIMRPLAIMRTLRFPRMARSALETVLERDWSRHVIGIRATPHTAAATPINGDGWRAAFAPTDTLDAIAELAEQKDWRGVRVVGSDDALTSAMRATSTDSRDADGVFVVVCDSNGPVEGIYIRNGQPVLGRRFPSDAIDEDVEAFARTVLLEESGPENASVVVIGVNARVTALVRFLNAGGRRARTMDVGAPAGSSLATIVAIAGTQDAHTLELRSPVARRVRVTEMRRVARWLGVAAALAVIAAFLIDSWGTDAAIAKIRDQRGEIATNVRRAMLARTRVDAATAAVTALAAREAAASRASEVMTAITIAIPAGSALTTLVVAGDSVTIEGESKRSGAVYDAIRAIPTLDRVSLAAPLRQERQAGDIAVERFAFSARVKARP